MTNKVYKTAQGQAVDLGTIMLKNEHVRAVGNMNVNARGDKLDQNNRVVETKAQQIQKQNAKTTTNVSASTPVHHGSAKSRKAKQADNTPTTDTTTADTTTDTTATADSTTVDASTDTTAQANASASTDTTSSNTPQSGGLAAAIARQREVKQQLEKTPRQQAQSQGLRKI